MVIAPVQGLAEVHRSNRGAHTQFDKMTILAITVQQVLSSHLGSH